MTVDVRGWAAAKADYSVVLMARCDGWAGLGDRTTGCLQMADRPSNCPSTRRSKERGRRRRTAEVARPKLSARLRRRANTD